MASYGGGLPYVGEGDTWLKGSSGNAGKVPAQVAQKLSGKTFRNFDHFRQEFWKAVASDPIVSSNFNINNIKRMQSGKAPYAIPTEQVGSRKVYELDHNQEIKNGGNVYDMNNIIIRTPYNHIKKGGGSGGKK